ncbi:hypothetical protein [Ruegeria sp. Ofav3-42]|uniref:hypothetical protein n=1 Tax=Ruegeria sp. Ofav3-42 TaxID=2917759 RepID=UPI001EF6745F|nr:hypothetical protein [Ruegeria sp. Ofav3-42]MCG7521787.1 hypothetical protein [Ruegeria sp. Ofav3-42]
MIKRADGRPLPFQLLHAERRQRTDRASPLAGMPDPITGGRIPAPPEDPDVIYINAFYSFEGARPERLIFHPPQDEDGLPAVSIGFMVIDRSVPVTRFSFLKTDTRLAINWTDPWFTAFSNPNLNRSARSGTTSFLYVEPRELRHEVLIRVRELAPWIGQNLTTGARLEPAHQSQILTAALENFAHRNPVSIAGMPSKPALVRGSFLTLGERGFEIVEDAPMLIADTTFVGVILTYPISELPVSASITWDMFDDTIQEVPVTLTDIAGPFLDWGSSEDPKITWTNHLKQYVDPKVTPVEASGIVFVPLLALLAFVLSITAGFVAFRVSEKPLSLVFVVLSTGFLITGLSYSGEKTVPFLSPVSDISKTQIATDAFTRLLANTYVAALEVFPEERKEALEPIVFDAAKADITAELETSLTIQVPGGGRAQIVEITDVVIVQGEMDRRGEFEGVAQWRVEARAGHWGHDHRRRVDYRARVAFRPDKGNWALSAITVLEARSPDV